MIVNVFCIGGNYCSYNGTSGGENGGGSSGDDPWLQDTVMLQ